MLNESFEGEVTFSGSVRISLRIDRKNPSLDDESPPTFFHSNGQFSLQKIGSDQRVEEGSYALGCSNSEFYFKPKKGIRIESHYQESYGDVIAFPIDFPFRAQIQIEPKSGTINF